jgi:two-component sensor histidine kinase
MDFIENENQKNILQEVDLRLNTMALVHEMLYSKNELDAIPLKEYIEELVTTIDRTINTNDIQINYIFDIQQISLNISNSINLGMFVNEAVTNAIKYAFVNIKNPEIRIELILKDNFYVFKIKDNGIGIDNTKKTKENSFGIKLFDIFARQIDAQLEIISKNGTEISLSIPPENLI